jgi:hypothetical protein
MGFGIIVISNSSMVLNYTIRVADGERCRRRHSAYDALKKIEKNEELV